MLPGPFTGSDQSDKHHDGADPEGVGATRSWPEPATIAPVLPQVVPSTSDEAKRVVKMPPDMKLVDALPPPPETTRPNPSRSTIRPSPANQWSSSRSLRSTESGGIVDDLDLDDVRAAQEEELLNFALEQSLTDFGDAMDREQGLDVPMRSTTLQAANSMGRDRQFASCKAASELAVAEGGFVETARTNRISDYSLRNARITPLVRLGRGAMRSTSTENLLGSTSYDSPMATRNRRLSDSWVTKPGLSPSSAMKIHSRTFPKAPVIAEETTKRSGRAVVLEAAMQHLSPTEVKLVVNALSPDTPPLRFSGNKADTSPGSARQFIQRGQIGALGSGSSHSSPGYLQRPRSPPLTATDSESSIFNASDYNLDGAEEHLSSRELAQIRQALAESEKTDNESQRLLRDTASSGSKVDVPPLSSQFDLDIAKQHLSEQELFEIRQALQDSEASTGIDSYATKLEPDDSEAILKALHDAEEAMEWKSFELAVRMAQNESMPLRSISPARQNQGNIRTMTRAQYNSELFAQSEQISHLHPYNDDMEGNSYVAAGFRMNSSMKHEWCRKDHNSVVGPNHEIHSKHDPWLQSLSNAARLGLDTDAGQVPTIGTRAYNSFMESMRRSSKGVAAHGSGRAGADSDEAPSGAVDPNVRMQIADAVNSGIIDRCSGVVKEGKEAVVYHAERVSGSNEFDIAVKVFKRMQEFRGRNEYVDGDPRYSSVQFRKAGEHDQLEIWAEKEFRNLMTANRAGVPVPTPLYQKENIVFMRFMGIDGWPAPQLNEIEIQQGSQRWIDMYGQVINAVACLYQNARLVHGDLSEYNIMVVPGCLVDNSDETGKNDLQIVLIDFAQAVDIRHPHAEIWLRRDLSGVNIFFSRMGVQTLTVDDLITIIAGQGNC